MKGYKIVIASRPSHPYELRLNAFLISPSGQQVVLRGFNHLYSDNEIKMRKILKYGWPGIPVSRDDDHYIPGVHPVPTTSKRQANANR
jgi:hypothetical protein